MVRLFILAIFAVGVPLGLFGAGLTLKNHFDNRAEYALLEDHGQQGEAYAIEREQVSRRRVSLSGRFLRSSGYFVTYRFDANSGSRGTLSFNAALAGDEQTLDLTSDNLDFRIPASREQYDAAEDAGRVNIIFLPEEPHVVRLLDADGGYKRPSGLPWAVGLVILAGISGMMFHQYRTTGRTM